MIGRTLRVLPEGQEDYQGGSDGIPERQNPNRLHIRRLSPTQTAPFLDRELDPGTPLPHMTFLRYELTGMILRNIRIKSICALL